MSTATGTEAEGAEGAAGGEGEQTQEQQATFTQAEVDRIVAQRAERIAKQRYGDYDDLKAKAEGAKTLEERFAAVESELATTKADALRTRIASKYGISTEAPKDGEPSDADLFLTGTDEATLTAQAQRLAAQVADRKQHGNVAPKEGTTTTTGGADQETREFARNLFGSAD